MTHDDNDDNKADTNKVINIEIAIIIQGCKVVENVVLGSVWVWWHQDKDLTDLIQVKYALNKKR